MPEPACEGHCKWQLSAGADGGGLGQWRRRLLQSSSVSLSDTTQVSTISLAVANATTTAPGVPTSQLNWTQISGYVNMTVGLSVGYATQINALYSTSGGTTSFGPSLKTYQAQAGTTGTGAVQSLSLGGSV